MEIDDIEMIPVISSNIAEIGYSEEDEFLVVEFKSGDRWGYSGVPYDVFAGLRDAGSVGSFFAREVKGSYPSRRL